jgi:isoquinoline 1-oxidoreductase
MADSAAKTWGVARSGVDVKDAHVINRSSGARLSYGELASKIDWVKTIGRDDCVTPADKWTVAGTNVPKVNGRELVTGAHQYPSDQKRPGMLYGKVLRPPIFGDSLTSVDTS